MKRVGADYLGENRCEFIVWGPLLSSLSLQIVSPANFIVPMVKDEQGYWKAVVDNVSPGTLYFYKLGNCDRPDPASTFQPQGVFGPSQVLDHNTFQWKDESWKVMLLERMIIYELHVGTFSNEGTFEGVIKKLDELSDLGINAIEIMPVAQFSGERNWGYDGVYPFAVQNSYGGPEGLKQLINESHKRGIAVILDVVYNHLGPEGNFSAEFGPYFTDKYKTPWGKAINFDDAYSKDVRDIFIQNALCWFERYHIDALRLDAVHGIYDMSAKHFLRELSERVEEFSEKEKRKLYLIAESDLNDVRLVNSREKGGHGLHAQWCDDFHHAVHALLTGERQGYYQDFGKVEHFVKAFSEGFVYSGEYSFYRKRNHGSCSKDISPSQLVVCSQNHDQVGNRILGERLSRMVSLEALKLAAGALFLSTYVPLIFMGEEYGEDSPFFYFISFQDSDLVAAVREGRKEEFKSFKRQEDPPDPYDNLTFSRSKLKWEKKAEGKNSLLFKFYKTLIHLRKTTPALLFLNRNSQYISALEKQKIIFLKRWHDDSYIYSAMNFSDKEELFKFDCLGGQWRRILDSSDGTWMGPGSGLPETVEPGKNLIMNPFSFVLYQRVC